MKKMKKLLAGVTMTAFVFSAGYSINVSAASAESLVRTSDASASIANVEIVVRMAEIEVDPAQLDNFKAEVTEEMKESIKVEPGVYAIYAVAVKDHPTQLRFFEIYANEKAYEAHRQTPHFKKYIETTKNMILSKKLIEVDPVLLSSKNLDSNLLK